MAAHDKLTIVAIYGHTDGSSAIPSLLVSKAQLPGARALLVSPKKPRGLPKDIAWKRCFPMNYQQYSVFCIHCLYHYIKTEYCLIVQDDSWVLNGENFHEHYYDYDYVGAPAHAAMVGDIFHIQWSWLGKEAALEVQNGGFSLRSRRLLKAPTFCGLPYIPFPQQPFCNEDVQLTSFHRRALESLGLKFAPKEVAKHFSVEYMGPGFHDDLDFNTLVGCHAPTRQLMQDKVVFNKHSITQNSTYFREMDFLQWLQSKGYSIQFGPHHDSASTAHQDRTQASGQKAAA